MNNFNRRYWKFAVVVRRYTFKKMSPLFERYFKKIINYLDANKNAKILDVGCGFGYFLKICEKKTNWALYGVDISRYAINRAKRNVKAIYYVHDVNEGLNLFPQNYFDLLVSFDVIEHLNSPFLFLKEVHRVLKPNGIIAITTPNSNAIERLFKKLLGKENTWHGFLDNTHIYQFTPLSLRFLIEKAGFKILDLETPFHPLPKILQKILNRSGLGGQIWIVGKK